jgi:hypothetical protein
VQADTVVKRCPRCAEDIRNDAMVCRYCRHEFASPSHGELVSRWVRSHPTPMISLVTFLFVTFQVYKAGDFEVNVELFRSSGLTTILTGVLLQELPFLLILLTFGTCWWLIGYARDTPPRTAETRIWRSSTDPRNVPQLLLLGLLVIGFYTIPWPLFLLSLVSSVVALTIAHRHEPAGRRTVKVTGRTMATVSLLLVTYLLYTHPVVWVPSENVTTTDRGTVVAFVVGEDDRFTTLLTPRWTGYLRPGENSVVREPTDHITARQLCSMDLLEAQLFGRVLRLRPVQLPGVIRRHRLPEPAQQAMCANQPG